jgi:hypothetical protein
MNNTVNCLYNFATTLTYDLLDMGYVEPELYISEYCNHHKVENNDKKVITDYYNYHIKYNNGWFPEFQEVSDWYDHYKKLKNLKNI